MIYVSTAGVTGTTIKDKIENLVNVGITKIELSGGSKPYSNLYSDLEMLKSEYNLDYLCHNYFPPPNEDFVFNLASMDKDIYNKSWNHALSAIELCKRLQISKIGFHAGFLFDIPLNEIGKIIEKKTLVDKANATHLFLNTIDTLQKEAGEIKMYIENNVLSNDNYKNFSHTNPFLLVDSKDYYELNKTHSLHLLLDIAHLKVSSQTLSNDFYTECSDLLAKTDYIHLSDNDGENDTNQSLNIDGDIWKFIVEKKKELKNKTITLELNTPLEEVREIYATLERIIYE